MRDKWVDSGDGILTINTPRLYIRLYSRARKNYRTIYSNWQLSVGVKGEYGYAVRFYYDFGHQIRSEQSAQSHTEEYPYC